MSYEDMKNDKVYASIDLKSFYASVECIELGLDPMTTNLVVADKSRTSKTICLAVSPSLKNYGVPSRPRLFEVEAIIDKININKPSPNKSYDFTDLQKDKNLKIDYIVTPPRMAKYLEYSSKIHEIYYKFFDKKDVHIYSVDEIFVDLTPYIKIYNMSPMDIVRTVVMDIFNNIGIVATAGVGTNMYLSKIAMDIKAKHVEADETGCRVAYLDENMYKKDMWSHTPLTDFWMVGRGIAKKLEKFDLYTMGDIALVSLGKERDFYNEELLFKLFGVSAELLIDHAWGIEPCKMSDIKNYIPKTNSYSNGQVLSEPYTYDKAKVIIREMCENLVLDMNAAEKELKNISIEINYDSSNVEENSYKGSVKKDYYGRLVPKPLRCSYSFDEYTASMKEITNRCLQLYETRVDRTLSIRKITVSFNKLREKSDGKYRQLSIFGIADNKDVKINEIKLQEALVNIRKRYGKNAILKGNNLLKESTIIDRNAQIGGHKA